MTEAARRAVAAAGNHHGPVAPWAFFAKMFPIAGPPGLGLGPADGTRRTLTWRTEQGQLVGMLLQHHTDGRPGPLVVAVHPAHQGCGIGTELIEACLARWGIDVAAQQFTAAGRAMAEGILRRRPVRMAGHVAPPGA